MSKRSKLWAIIEDGIHARDRDRDRAGKEWDIAQCEFHIRFMCSRILKLVPKEIKNKDIKQFGCYNTEGNIKMQDGYNLAVQQTKRNMGIRE